MPKPPRPLPQPTAPTAASFITRGSTGQPGFGQRPNKLINPVIGQSTSNVGAPSLLGGF